MEIASEQRKNLELTGAVSTNIAIATCIRTNQNPNIVRRREASPNNIWVLCPNKNGDSYNLSIEEFLALPETKPVSEYIDGQIYQKPLPQLQLWMF